MTNLLYLLLLPWAAAQAQSADVDAYIRTTMEQRDIPGLSLAVLRDGKMVKRGMYGLANVELNVPVTTPTKFFIASTTKNFAGVAMMMLIAEGKLSPQKTVDFLNKNLK